MHGIGNDYIYIDCFKQAVPEDLSALSVRLSAQHTGIGGDGIVLILPSEKAICRMRMLNADGSEGNMCGNAIRCVGKYIYENGITKETEVTVETKSGIKTLTLHISDNSTVERVTVNMGKADFSTKSLPMVCQTETFIGQGIKVNNTTYRCATAVSMGNPHLVILHKDVDNIDLARTGKPVENHASFPERVNTEFAEVIAPNTIKMRVWERGSGETMACGTGACAVAAAFSELNLVDSSLPITVRLKGGDLTITYLEDKTVFMEGCAEEVFRGTIKID